MNTDTVRYFATDKNKKNLDYIGFLNYEETRSKEELKPIVDSMVTGSDYEMCDIILVSHEEQIIKY